MGKKQFNEDLEDWSWRDAELHTFLKKSLKLPVKIPRNIQSSSGIDSVLKYFGPMGKLGTALKIISPIVTIAALAYLALKPKRSRSSKKSMRPGKRSRPERR